MHFNSKRRTRRSPLLIALVIEYDLVEPSAILPHTITYTEKITPLPLAISGIAQAHFVFLEAWFRDPTEPPRVARQLRWKN